MRASCSACGNYVRSSAAVLCVAMSLLIAGEKGLCVDESESHPILAIGSRAPDVCLPGVDGANHCL